jgi:hypothetical protein
MNSTVIKNIVTAIDSDGCRVSKTAIFDHYLKDNLIYKIGDFEFPISTEEAKGGCFNREMKAITLMRWVRKHVHTSAE